MSIDVLISGRLRGVPSPRTAANGSPYLLFRVAAIDKTGESLLCGCIAFADSVIQAVQALGEGDSIAVTGEASISVWNGSGGADRYGLDVTAHGVLTAYHIGRKRKASAGDESTDE
jgi:single-stranded DNA-binding protein